VKKPLGKRIELEVSVVRASATSKSTFGIFVNVPRQLSQSDPLFEVAPAYSSLKAASAAAKKCQACDLWRNATQTVFGEGSARARVMFVGEQPGDKEDLEGRPFVGPAGALFDKAIEEAGIDRKQTYVTNAVKHFKWEPRGKRRIHKKPNSLEISACRSWLDVEIALVRPAVIVCLGATAAQALLGRAFRVTRQRGKLLPFATAPHVLATVHPSSILRAPDEESRRRDFGKFVQDLSVVAKLLHQRDAA
jgi:uracil-DNA glycosylase family protein